jgi:hypothetical protein
MATLAAINPDINAQFDRLARQFREYWGEVRRLCSLEPKWVDKIANECWEKWDEMIYVRQERDPNANYVREFTDRLRAASDKLELTKLQQSASGGTQLRNHF